MRPIRDFFARPDFWKLMGADFQPQKYRTKGELLVATLTHALALRHVKDNPALFACLSEFLSSLKKSHVTATGGATPLAINMQTLVKALPLPETTQEEQHLRQLQELFQNQQFHALLGPVLVRAKLRTRGAALQLLLQKALEMQKKFQAQAATLQALQYFQNRVIHEGYGAQAVDLLVPQKMEISVLDLFRAIDHDRLSAKDRQRVKRVINFISHNFNPSKYLNGFKFEQYGTKGEFLKAAFERMCKLKYLRPQLRDDMTFLTNYITDQGPGAEPLNGKAENMA
ncbi:hypothetical protein R5R35_012660 [Gryllus longicercus]|uniref:Uncharacterized protein n=1 Tax=Gryllus longicercus TaxID=2509291 RepID=A0AAN9V4F1_9ORTH